MGLFGLLKFKEKSFSAKIFYILALFVFVFYISFSVFFIYYQKNALKSNLLRQGTTLANLFAYNARLGVFAENSNMLKDPAEGLTQHKEVILIQAFTKDRKELIAQYCNDHKSHTNSAGMHISSREINNTVNRISGASDTAYVVEQDDIISFWAPVLARTIIPDEEAFIADPLTQAKNNIIGYVRIVFSTRAFNDDLKVLILKGTMLPVLFLLPCWFAIYFIFKKITSPLQRLTEGVEAVGQGGPVKMVHIETDDEIGKLARAFNNMVISLKTKEAEKNHIEEQLRKSQRLEAIGTFAGGIAHDFNNILSIIAGYTGLLKKKNDFRDESKQYIENLMATTERASSLIKSLLAFSRQQTIELRPVNINTIITKLHKNLLRMLGDKIRLETMLEDKDLYVTSETFQIEQVLLNLAINARDAMPEGGALTISTKYADMKEQFPTFSGYAPAGQYVVISVKDTGTGMENSIADKIFDPFFTTKGPKNGTGLGLSMVYGIIKQHNGFININSRLGQGTTFMIYLKSCKPGTEREEPEPAETPDGNETILVAEDEPDIRTLTAHILEQSGYRVLEAVDGKDAVNKFMANRGAVDLLLFDEMMPGMNGMEAYREIKLIRPDIKALFVSGNADWIIHGSVTHPDNNLHDTEQINFLAKPVLPDKLTKKIREILDN